MNTNCDAIAGSDKFEQEISMDTVFVFPEPLTEHDILGQHLIIAPENANWLVCDDDAYKAFSFFKAGNSIQEVEDCLCKQGIDSSTASEVVSQLIAQILGKDFLQQATVIEKEAFKSVSILLTAGCNLRCSTCFLSATVAGPDECTYADWKRFLKAFAKMGGEEVVLTGGEPTMNPDCGNIIAFAKSLGLNVILATNGNLINAENAHIFGNNCNEIRISIDGPNEETHDSVRGKGTFKKAVGALKALSVYADC